MSGRNRDETRAREKSRSRIELAATTTDCTLSFLFGRVSVRGVYVRTDYKGASTSEEAAVIIATSARYRIYLYLATSLFTLSFVHGKLSAVTRHCGDVYCVGFFVDSRFD